MSEKETQPRTATGEAAEPPAGTATAALETPTPAPTGKGKTPGEPSEIPLPDLVRAGAGESGKKPAPIDLLKDVELSVKIELGRAKMLVEDILKLGSGSVVELDKLAGDPVDIFVNERLVARGEVLVLGDNFCVRVSQIVAGGV